MAPAAEEQDCTTEEEYKTQQGQREDQSWESLRRPSSQIAAFFGAIPPAALFPMARRQPAAFGRVFFFLIRPGI